MIYSINKKSVRSLIPTNEKIKCPEDFCDDAVFSEEVSFLILRLEYLCDLRDVQLALVTTLKDLAILLRVVLWDNVFHVKIYLIRRRELSYSLTILKDCWYFVIISPLSPVLFLALLLLLVSAAIISSLHLVETPKADIEGSESISCDLSRVESGDVIEEIDCY
ncbi:hypothetical protein RCL_jg160.t1 [Rhizophagus clarus]|uniref:Uncharacterized protein n=1 Tax=Rhizophagus clarus TaxID=94130 RepID=A0A8H3L147_9GLOM|nr:hypothetical protein RCL_jg160.t1 [Rhizophagus clarus]